MPNYPCYVVIKGVVPGVYETWSDVAVNIDGVRNPIYHGCKSLDEAYAIFRRHQDNGTVTVILPEGASRIKREEIDVPVFLSAARAPLPIGARSSTSSATSRRTNGSGGRRVTVESGSESDADDRHDTYVEHEEGVDHAAATPGGPHTPPRGGSRQGTPARGRARAASPTPAAPAARTRTTRADDEHSVDEEPRASSRTRRGTARANRDADHTREQEKESKRKPERSKVSTAAAKAKRNILIKNVFLADTDAPANARPSNPAGGQESSSSEDDESMAFFARHGSASSPDTEIEVELDDGGSGPEAVCDISFTPSPRRSKNNLQREASEPASRYGTPLSRQGSGSVTAVNTAKSRVHEATTRSKRNSNNPSLRLETPRRTNAKGSGLAVDTTIKRTSLSSSPPTGETQHEDGQVPFTWQRKHYTVNADTEFSISAALRSNKSSHHRSPAGGSGASAYDTDIDADIVPTRPNTPPPPVAPASSRSSSQRSRRPIVAVASIKLCDGCSQPLPNPPLPPPRWNSSSSSPTSHASSSTIPCKMCYQPLPWVTPAVSRSGSAKPPSGSDTMVNIEDGVTVDGAPQSTPATHSTASRPRTRTGSHARSGSTGMAQASPTRRRNALGLSGTGAGSSVLSSPSGLTYSGRGEDPRSPLQRSDTLSDIGSPRAPIKSFQSLSINS